MGTVVKNPKESIYETIQQYGDFNYVPVRFYLKPYIDFWLEKSEKDTGDYMFIQKTLQEHPQLLEPLDTLDGLEGYKEFLDVLFRPVFPREEWTKDLIAICAPFSNVPWLIASKPYVELHTANYVMDNMDSGPGQTPFDSRLLYTYKAVLSRFYNLDLKLEQPIVASCLDKESGLTRYYKLTGDTRFVEIENLGELPDITDMEINNLLDQTFDPDAWAKVLPIDQFLFKGISILRMVDVTSEEATNRLQYTLLHKGEGDEWEWLKSIERELRNVFRLPDLRLGIATIQGNGELNFNSARPLWNSLFLRQMEGDLSVFLKGSFYEEALAEGNMIIVEDLRELQEKDAAPVVRAMIEAGYFNMFLVPLKNEERITGLLEMLNPEPTALNGLSSFKVNQIKPIFANALKRHAEEFENRVEAVMLEEFTAIHPKIQWKFRDAAISIIENRQGDGTYESIVFHNLIPFYSSLDIRESSTKRNMTILHDLMDNLKAARRVLDAGHNLLSMAILEELDYQVSEVLQRMTGDNAAPDAQEIKEFVRTRVNPVIRSLKNQSPALDEVVTTYENQLDDESQVFVNHRLAYEQALALINRSMISYIQQQEDALLGNYPCYIDTYQTDGLEYNIYVGQEVAPELKFDPLIVDELRLLQLGWTLEIMGLVDTLQPRIHELLHCLESDSHGSGCLEIAPLILAYGDMLTLKFRMSEKRLDVDGSYNVRYEIIKKRIDKALIKGTGERLTQPGHIAIIYSREEDCQAYIQHLKYLTATKGLQSSWETFELASMPGAEGLRALRVKVGR